MSRKEFFRHSKAVTRSKRWKSLRQLVLRRDDFKCVECSSRHRLEVDHVVPVRTAPELSYEIENLQTLCKVCHARKTRVEVHGALPPEREAWRELILSMR